MDSEKVKQAFQAQFAAGAAHGFAEALEQLGINLDNQAQQWQAEIDASEDEQVKLERAAQIAAALAIREHLRGEQTKRRQLAQQLAQAADSSLGGAARAILGL